MAEQRDAAAASDNADKRRHRKKPPSLRQRVTMRALAWAAIALVWVLRLTCRIRVVHGAEHVDRALAPEMAAIVPCGWHRRIITSGLFLRSLVPRGLHLGFLISPSREGEFIARVARAHDTVTIRGSSSRSGKQAMRALTRAVREGISPMMYGDGPRGPAGRFKPGAVILASRSGAPLFLVGCVADRYWQLKSWDAGQIPKPFARLSVAVGEPWWIGTLEGTHEAEEIAEQIGRRLDRLDAVAEAAQRSDSESA